MSSSEIRDWALRRLLEDNFLMARHCRKATEKLADVSLSHYYQNISSRRSQFALELSDEIAFYSGKEPYLPSQPYDRSRKLDERGDRFQIVKKTLKLAKNSLKNYQEALSRIYEGSCREILIRHIAIIENEIFELKAIKTLVKYQIQENGQLKEENSHT